MPRQSLVLSLGLALLVGDPAFASHKTRHVQAAPGEFDYYVLSLTWVPGFCAAKKDPAECSKGLGFALHGLWPQYEGGSYPAFCGRAALSASDRNRFQDVYPSPSMIDHEWSKHGTCSGLAPNAYFTLSRNDLAAVAIPNAYRNPTILRARDAASVKQAFVAANSSLPTGGVKVVVSGGLVSEVDICLTKDGHFRPC
jgi:ribonuclease T2